MKLFHTMAMQSFVLLSILKKQKVGAERSLHDNTDMMRHRQGQLNVPV